MKTTVRKITATLLKQNSKAIAGALSGALSTATLAFFTSTGFTLETDEQTALYTLTGALAGALLNYAIVWVSPANQAKQKNSHSE